MIEKKTMNQVSEYSRNVGEGLGSVHGNYSMGEVIIHTSFGNFKGGIIAIRMNINWKWWLGQEVVNPFPCFCKWEKTLLERVLKK